MEKLKIKDRVKQRNTQAERHGTVMGFWEKDEYIDTENGKILFAVTGEVKVRFDFNGNDSLTTFNENQLIKL